MPVELGLTTATLFSFLLVLSRVAGVFVFIPLPGAKNAADAPKIVFSLCVTIALFPFWPRLVNQEPSFGAIVLWILADAALGLMIGLVVAFLMESFVLAAQMAALQAGYSYASTIDPNTQADSGVLSVILQLISGLLFFAFGLDRSLLRILAQSLTSFPPGTLIRGDSAVPIIQQLGSAMFSTGLRLALPVLALLMLVDVALALLGRVSSQLQLLSLAFPLKMLAALATLAAMATVLPAVYEKAADRSLQALSALLR